jgi:hypothetical protein
VENPRKMQGVDKTRGGGSLLDQNRFGGEQARGRIELATSKTPLRCVATKTREKPAKMGGIDSSGRSKVAERAKFHMSRLDQPERSMECFHRTGRAGDRSRPLPTL